MKISRRPALSQLRRSPRFISLVAPIDQLHNVLLSSRIPTVTAPGGITHQPPKTPLPAYPTKIFSIFQTLRKILNKKIEKNK
jgi:hypothetical protein